MKCSSLSVKGLRPQNEDSCFTRFEVGKPLLAAVADGMGGHAAGDVASKIAVETLDYCTREDSDNPQNELSEAFYMANDKVLSEAKSDRSKRGMGSTMVAALFYSDHFITANVGDSRLYLINTEGIRQVTFDHSYVQELLRAGVITKEKAKTHPNRNFITRCIGSALDFEPDVFYSNWKRGDTVLLCSDGLCGAVEDEELLSLVLSFEDLDAACKKLTDVALKHGSTDNITVVLVRNEDSLQV